MLQYIPFIGNLIGKSIDGKIEKNKNKFQLLKSDKDFNSEVQRQYASEFRNINNRTIWDSFIDGLNRLPRPLLAIQAIIILDVMILYPDALLRAREGFESVPPELWNLIQTVVTFYFGVRGVQVGIDSVLNYKYKKKTLSINTGLKNNSNYINDKPEDVQWNKKLQNRYILND